MANVIFLRGTKPLFDQLPEKDPNTLYWLDDSQELYKGEKLYGTGALATAQRNGLMSAVDKKKLDDLSAGGAAGLTPVDASIILGDGEDGTKTIGVQLSKEVGNLIQLKQDGLFAGVDTSGFVVQEIVNQDGGKAIIQNEPTGGGAKYHHPDGSQAFVGVNDGGLTGMMAQIYADKEENGSWIGSRLNIYQKGMFYHNAADKASPDYVADDPDHEIATLGDIPEEQVYVTNGLTALSQGASTDTILASIGSYESLLDAVRANKVVLDRDHTASGASGVENPKVAIHVSGNEIALNLVFMTGSDVFTIYQVQNVGGTLALGVTDIQFAREADLTKAQETIDSMPDEILSDIVNVKRTETTNTAEIRIFTKQDDGTYSPDVKHGVLTLIPAGSGPDGVNGAGLMSYQDKQSLDSVVDSLTWGEL